jgi:hypothetical protein
MSFKFYITSLISGFQSSFLAKTRISNLLNFEE